MFCKVSLGFVFWSCCFVFYFGGRFSLDFYVVRGDGVLFGGLGDVG